MIDSRAMTIATISYASRVDVLSPLYADVCFIADGRPKPMVAVMHGFGCKRQYVTWDCMCLARRGLFCVAPDMRGHSDSAGEHDCGGLQICDIVDALGEAARRFPADANRHHVNAIGYSGGGGNVLSLATKFPDLLNAGACFFGISDYELWHATRGREDCNKLMERVLGGTPQQVPDRYAARSSLRAIANNAHTTLHVLWDAEEKGCPPILNERLIEASGRLGYDNIRAHVSKPGDAHRWHHGYRMHVSDLNFADDLYVDDMLAAPAACPFPLSGELCVAGYVVTPRFALWLGDGLSGFARVRYDLAGERLITQVIESTPDAPPLRVVRGASLLDWFAK